MVLSEGTTILLPHEVVIVGWTTNDILIARKDWCDKTAGHGNWTLAPLIWDKDTDTPYRIYRFKDPEIALLFTLKFK